MALTPKQQRFVQEYLIDLNATQAAIRAGYSENRASEIGYQQLQKTTVSGAIQRAQEERSARVQLTADYVIERLKVEAEYYGDGCSHSARVSALSQLGKHIGMFAERPDDPDKNGGLIELARTFDLSQLTEEEAKTLEQILIKIEAASEANDRNDSPPDAGGGTRPTEADRRGKGGPAKGRRKK